MDSQIRIARGQSTFSEKFTNWATLFLFFAVVLVSVYIGYQVGKLIYKKDIEGMEARIEQMDNSIKLAEHANKQINDELKSALSSVKDYKGKYDYMRKLHKDKIKVIEKEYTKEELDALCISRVANHYPK